MKVFTMENSFLDHEGLKTEWETIQDGKGLRETIPLKMW